MMYQVNWETSDKSGDLSLFSRIIFGCFSFQQFVITAIKEQIQIKLSSQIIVSTQTNSSVQQSLRLDYILTERSHRHHTNSPVRLAETCMFNCTVTDQCSHSVLQSSRFDQSQIIGFCVVVWAADLSVRM